MIDLDLIGGFTQLFYGRDSAHGTEHGGSAPTPPDFSAHLYGQSTPIGVYPMVPIQQGVGGPLGWSVCWGCVDLDVKGPSHKTGYESTAKAYEAACNLRAVLKHQGITSWVEVTRSGGYHVWIFATEWVEASTMRRALLVACEVAGVPPTEVNPKSEGFADPATLGNYVRLPYPGWVGVDGGTDERRVMLDEDGEEIGLVTFVADAEESLTSPRMLENLAALWRAPVTQGSVEFEGGADLEAAQKQLNGLAHVIATNPPLEGQDRSTRLFKLACECQRSGISPSEAALVLEWADALHGQKYLLRADAKARYETTVRRAYA